ncbi:hypothetical protein B0T25DRAFT_12055 [Lasiosphaeria hispida]|uniref:Uncharacterized protein n=1 Tax=Lasiosphaeria hispida TaxID=260671 RepID=A0AAJ0MJM5_9PEZI|nr:hypothetical protein B0T25DRAFT_12055 [Lasiosphaeria hispida]
MKENFSKKNRAEKKTMKKDKKTSVHTKNSGLLWGGLKTKTKKSPEEYELKGRAEGEDEPVFNREVHIGDNREGQSKDRIEEVVEELATSQAKDQVKETLEELTREQAKDQVDETLEELAVDGQFRGRTRLYVVDVCPRITDPINAELAGIDFVGTLLEFDNRRPPWYIGFRIDVPIPQVTRSWDTPTEFLPPLWPGDATTGITSPDSFQPIVPGGAGADSKPSRSNKKLFKTCDTVVACCELALDGSRKPWEVRSGIIKLTARLVWNRALGRTVEPRATSNSLSTIRDIFDAFKASPAGSPGRVFARNVLDEMTLTSPQLSRPAYEQLIRDCFAKGLLFPP